MTYKRKIAIFLAKTVDKSVEMCIKDSLLTLYINI